MEFMDFYGDPEWRAEHPQIAALYDIVCPEFDPRSWGVLYAQQGETWYCLTRGIFGNPDGFYLSWGPKREILMDLLSNENNNWFVSRRLSSLIHEATTKYHIDLLAIPLEGWQEY